MNSLIPPWLKSPSGLLIASGLLVALLVAVPQYISTSRSASPAEASVEVGHPAQGAAEALGDPLGAGEDDWLATGDAGDRDVPDDASGQEDALDCLIQPSQLVEIGSQTIGLIQAVTVDRGDLIEEGQVLVELEAGVEVAAVEVARMRASMKGALRAREEALTLSASRRKRGAELYQQRALSEDTRQELETGARIAELELMQAREARQLASLELHQARARLARRSLRSPISGVVVERLLEPGEVVDEETILRIAAIDPLRVEVLLPASRYGSVRPGMRAAVEPEFPADTRIVATVSVVDPIIDAASGTFSARLDLPNPHGQIPGGLHCTVKFLDE